MDLAVDLEWRKDNPVKGVKRFPTSAEGFHTWDEGEIARFYEIHKIGSAAHLAMTLMLHTGAAKCDAVRLGKGSIRDGRLVYRRSKTRRNPEGIEVTIPVYPYLAQTLALVRTDAFTYLGTSQRLARTAAGLGNSMRKWCDKAGLPNCSSHGLRKATGVSGSCSPAWRMTRARQCGPTVRKGRQATRLGSTCFPCSSRCGSTRDRITSAGERARPSRNALTPCAISRWHGTARGSLARAPASSRPSRSGGRRAGRVRPGLPGPVAQRSPRATAP